MIFLIKICSKFLELQKNLTSRNLKAIEQSNLDARFVISEGTDSSQLKGREVRILKKFKLKLSDYFFEKTKKNTISRKPLRLL